MAHSVRIDLAYSISAEQFPWLPIQLKAGDEAVHAEISFSLAIRCTGSQGSTIPQSNGPNI